MIFNQCGIHHSSHEQRAYFRNARSDFGAEWADYLQHAVAPALLVLKHAMYLCEILYKQGSAASTADQETASATAGPVPCRPAVDGQRSRHGAAHHAVSFRGCQFVGFHFSWLSSDGAMPVSGAATLSPGSICVCVGGAMGPGRLLPVGMRLAEVDAQRTLKGLVD